MKRYLCLFGLALLISMSLSTYAQTDSADIAMEEDDPGAFEWLKGDMNETHEYGIRLGTNTTTMLGGELKNPTTTFGLNGSVYYRYKFKPKDAVQIDLGFSMRGSNFNNNIGEYEAIRVYYLDAPIMWVHALNQKATTHAVIGLQYSQLLNSSIYIKPQALPESDKPKFKTYDVMALAGAQFYSGFIGFQLIAKYGLVNINDGLIPNLNPAFKNKDIHNFAFEINFLF